MNERSRIMESCYMCSEPSATSLSTKHFHIPSRQRAVWKGLHTPTPLSDSFLLLFLCTLWALPGPSVHCDPQVRSSVWNGFPAFPWEIASHPFRASSIMASLEKSLLIPPGRSVHFLLMARETAMGVSVTADSLWSVIEPCQGILISFPSHPSSSSQWLLQTLQSG